MPDGRHKGVFRKRRNHGKTITMLWLERNSGLDGLHTDFRHWTDELRILERCRCFSWMHHGVIRRMQVNDIRERVWLEIRRLEKAMREEESHGEKHD